MNKVAILGLLVCLSAISDTVKADTSQERMIELGERDKRVQMAYHNCVRKVNRNFNPKRDDGILLIMRCRAWAMATTQ